MGLSLRKPSTRAGLHVAIADMSRRHWAVNIRKLVVPAEQLSDLVQLGTLPGAAADSWSIRRRGLTILVGPRGPGC